MINKKSPAVISVMAEKSPVLEKIALQLGFKYHEELVEGGSIIKFHFLLNTLDTLKLIQSIPEEVYAFRGEFRNLD